MGKIVWCHPQCKLIYGQEERFSSFCNYCSLYVIFVCSRVVLHLFIGVPEGVLKSFSAIEILRGEKAGFSGLYTEHTDVSSTVK